MLELWVCVVVCFAGFASCCCQGAKTPPKRVERATVKLLALFKDDHGVLGVPLGVQGPAKLGIYMVIYVGSETDFGGGLRQRMLIIENQGES